MCNPLKLSPSFTLVRGVLLDILEQPLLSTQYSPPDLFVYHQGMRNFLFQPLRGKTQRISESFELWWHRYFGPKSNQKARLQAKDSLECNIKQNKKQSNQTNNQSKDIFRCLKFPFITSLLFTSHSHHFFDAQRNTWPWIFLQRFWYFPLHLKSS